MKSKSLLVIILNIGLVCLALGRATETLTPAEAKARFEAARAEIVSLRSNIVLTLELLDQVRAAKDQQGQFQKFSIQLTNLEVQAQLVSARVQTMKAKGDGYFADWEARTAQLQDPDARRWAAERYTARKKSYDRLVSQLQQAREDFMPMLSGLKQIQGLLAANRDPSRIAAAKDLFMRANWRCVDVQRALMEVEAEFSFLASDFALHEKSGETGI